MIGKVVSHYPALWDSAHRRDSRKRNKILEKLGEGGMGVVYKAQDLTLDRLAALKFLPTNLTPDPEAKQRFILEAKAASALEHANICSIHEIGEHDGQTFIVMGHYEGETLKKKIERRPLPIHETVNNASQVAQGLTKAHESKLG